jgi:zinc protease
LEREREVQLAALRAQRDQLLQSCFRAMRRAIFGETGYGLDAVGSEESVRNLQTSDLKSFHQTRVSPDNCVLAIYGDVKSKQVLTSAKRAFARWKRAGSSAPPPDTRTRAGRITETRDKKQAVVVVAFPGTTVHSADRYALELIQESCSDLGSRLFLRIRDQLGLAYYVGAQNFFGLAPGYFAFYCGTAPEKVVLVEEELLKEVALLRQGGLNAEELKRAKAKLIGQKKIARQDLGSFAMTTALDELYGLGHANTDTEDAKYEAVTQDQIRSTAVKYLDTDQLVVAVAGPKKT